MQQWGQTDTTRKQRWEVAAENMEMCREKGGLQSAASAAEAEAAAMHMVGMVARGLWGKAGAEMQLQRSAHEFDKVGTDGDGELSKKEYARST